MKSFLDILTSSISFIFNLKYIKLKGKIKERDSKLTRFTSSTPKSWGPVTCRLLLEAVPVDITLVVAWLETGRHSAAALWCIIRGRVAEDSEFRGIKVSAEVKGWQLIPTRESGKTKRIVAPQIRVLLYYCLKGLFQISLPAYIHQEGSEAPRGRVLAFILQGNPFIHVNHLFPGVLLYQSELPSSNSNRIHAGEESSFWGIDWEEGRNLKLFWQLQ